MTTLARRLRLIDYFSLAFGTMIGTGWLVVMDDWLIGSGPAGAILGFLAGGAMLFPIGYVYGKLVMAMPDAGGGARLLTPPRCFLASSASSRAGSCCWLILLSARTRR